MHIILGYELDTGSYPDALGNDEAQQGVVVLGPAGLVGVLETCLGLTRIQIHPAIRIGQYLKRLKDADNNERFYSKSIRVNAWSTAKQVLAWRDELVLAGWKGDVPGQISNRLHRPCGEAGSSGVCTRARRPLAAYNELSQRSVVSTKQCGSIISISYTSCFLAAHSEKSGGYKVKLGSIPKPALLCMDYP